MKYVYKCEFKGDPECVKCMLSEDDGVHSNCMALGSRPRCPEDEGCRKDCPLQLTDVSCHTAGNLLPDGKIVISDDDIRLLNRIIGVLSFYSDHDNITLTKEVLREAKHLSDKFSKQIIC